MYLSFSIFSQRYVCICIYLKKKMKRKNGKMRNGGIIKSFCFWSFWMGESDHDGYEWFFESEEFSAQRSLSRWQRGTNGK